LKYRDKKTGRVYEPNSSGWIEIKTDYGTRTVDVYTKAKDFSQYFEEVKESHWRCVPGENYTSAKNFFRDFKEVQEPELNGAQDFVPPYNKEPNYHQQFEDCKYALRNIKKLLEEAEKRVGDFNAQ